MRKKVDGNNNGAVLALYLGCLAILAWAPAVTVALAASDIGRPAAVSSEAPIQFDIAPQPLAAALDRYGDATGREVFYDAALAQGRQSGGIKGSFMPAAALRRLLEGTGLSARFMADESFVLLQTPSPNGRPAVHAAPPALQQRYYARIQESLRDAFCGSSAAPAGRYRVAALFWIDPSGNVQGARRLGSAGSSDIDSRIDETLHSVRLGEPPPPGFMQPVLFMVVPQAPGVTMGCESGGAGPRPVRAERP